MSSKNGRPLPAIVNPLMVEDVPSHDVLVLRRRLGQTSLDPKAGQVVTSKSAANASNLETFDYLHLRAILPKGIKGGIWKGVAAPASYFLMRRSSDGYVSATGMFKATFPYSEVSEEEAERKYIRSLPTTSPDEIAGNLWIPPEHALELAEEYRITPWIRALLDPTPPDAQLSKGLNATPITSPPKFLLPDDLLAPPASAPTPSRRSRRSVSPSKYSSPKKSAASTRSRKAKVLADAPVDASESNSTTKAFKETPEISFSPSVTPSITKETEQTATPAPTETTNGTDSEQKQEEPVVKVNVDTEVEVKGDVETTHTHVQVEMPAGTAELPLPEDTEAMIAKAKEMVEAAVKGTEAAGPSSASNKSKRKAEELEVEEQEAEVAEEAAPAKKAKVETQLRKERVKTRALIGLSATIALGAVIPYALNLF
ncbi:hypothetical protein F5884DRAFT_794006 [Xylogone sp. PMI_703]|nr:hypothetical protein F5884DRAFT_794006 [Xylogone sp. PMI_703]